MLINYFKKTNPINTILPNEVVRQVFELVVLDTNALSRCRRVCESWNIALNDKIFYRYIKTELKWQEILDSYSINLKIFLNSRYYKLSTLEFYKLLFLYHCETEGQKIKLLELILRYSPVDLRYGLERIKTHERFSVPYHFRNPRDLDLMVNNSRLSKIFRDLEDEKKIFIKKMAVSNLDFLIKERTDFNNQYLKKLSLLTQDRNEEIASEAKKVFKEILDDIKANRRVKDDIKLFIKYPFLKILDSILAPLDAIAFSAFCYYCTYYFFNLLTNHELLEIIVLSNTLQIIILALITHIQCSNQWENLYPSIELSRKYETSINYKVEILKLTIFMLLSAFSIFERDRFLMFTIFYNVICYCLQDPII